MSSFVLRFLLAANLTGHVLATSPITPAALANSSAVVGQPEIPAADFFRPPYLTSPSLNPAGTHIAALVTGTDEKRQFMVINLAAKSRKVVGGRGNKNIASFRWLNHDTLVFDLFSARGHQQAVLAARLGDLDNPYPLFQYGEPRLVAVPEDNPLRPVVWMRVDGYLSKAGLYALKADLRAGRVVDAEGGLSGELLENLRESNARHVAKTYPEPSGEITGYGMDVRGNLAFGWTIEAGREFLHLWDGESWAASPVDLDQVEILAAGEQPDELVVRQLSSQGRPGEVRLLNARTGAWGEFIFADDKYDFSGRLFRDPKSRKIVGTIFHRAGPQSQWFNDRYRSVQRALEASFPGKFVEILDSNSAGSVFTLAVHSDREPVSYYVTDLAKRSLDLIAAQRPWIDATRMRPVSIMSYESDDGVTLDAFVTIPAGASRENPAPLVVIPRYGVRHTWGYDEVTQFFASRGYAVLRPNHRGSAGFRWMLPREAELDFNAMERDVTNATQTVLKTGMVDAKRIAIIGYGASAYMAALGVMEHPELYCCAATISGIFDWSDLARGGQSRRYSDPHLQRIVRRIDTAMASGALDRVSLIERAPDLQRPVFIAHGDEANLVAPGQSRQLVNALRAAGRDVEEIEAGEGGLREASSAERVRLYTGIDEFMRRQLNR